MLRQLDAGRKVLHFPGGARRNREYLDPARAWRPIRLQLSRAGATDDRTNERRSARTQPRWQEAFRAGLAAARRVGSLRRQIGSLRSVPFESIGNGSGFFE